MPMTVELGWDEVRDAASKLTSRWGLHDVRGVYGVPRGGSTVAALVAPALGVPIVDSPEGRDDVLVVDDLVDSGATAQRYVEAGHLFDALYRKSESSANLAPDAVDIGTDWVVFPWEMGSDEQDGPTDAVRRLLEWVGEDPTRPGLVDTPKRVVKAWREMTEGYGQDPEVVLGRKFPDACDEMVVVENIEFTSLCEHHVLPFSGTATVGYLPDGMVVGLSKIPRVVDVFAHRLQVQERLTSQIAEAIYNYVPNRGVGVMLSATHSCMSCRGVRRPTARMITSSLLGWFRERPEVRAEFLALAERG